MMKVLLIKPEFRNSLTRLSLIVTEPLELEYLQAVCTDHEAESEICDMTAGHVSLKKTLKRFQPDVAAVTANFVHIGAVKKYAGIIKKFDPGIQVIVGGPHAEVVPEDFEFEGIDCVIYSGGFKPFEQIIEGQPGKCYPSVKGICYRENGRWTKNEREIFDVEDLPFPDRTHFYKNKNKYKYVNMKPCAIVKASYSCPCKCNYCFATLLNGGQYLFREPADVIEEIKSIDCENIWIVDDTFYVDKGRLDEFIELNRKEKLQKSYSVYYRADFIAANEEYMRRLSEIGVKMCAVGLEVIDDGVLEKYNKNSSVNTILEALRVLKECGIACVSLLMIDIDADRTYFGKLYAFIKKHELYLSTVAVLTPMPGTQQYEKYKDRLISRDYRKWDFIHLTVEPSGMSRSEFYRLFYILYMKLSLLIFRNRVLSAGYMIKAINASFEYWSGAVKDLLRREK